MVNIVMSAIRGSFRFIMKLQIAAIAAAGHGTTVVCGIGRSHPLVALLTLANVPPRAALAYCGCKWPTAAKSRIPASGFSASSRKRWSKYSSRAVMTVLGSFQRS